MPSPFDLNRYYPTPGSTKFVTEDDADRLFALDPEDDDGEEGYTSTAAPMVNAPQAPELSAPRQRSQSSLRLGEDYDTLRGELSKRPTLSAPKWWQQAAGAAAGFGAGWSNAASRTRRPIDIDAMQDNILHPGYRQKLEQWHSRIEPLQTIANLDRSQADSDRRERQLDIQDKWYEGRADEAHAKAKWWQGRPYPADKTVETQADRMERVKQARDAGYTIDDEQATYYVLNGNLTGYGSTLANPGSGARGHAATNPMEVLLDSNASPADKANAEKWLRVTHPGRQVDPGREEDRQFNREMRQNRTFDQIQTHKDSSERAILGGREKELAKLMTVRGVASEEDLADDPDYLRINNKYARELQSNQNSYEQSIKRQPGASARHVTYNPRTLEASEQADAPLPAAPTAPAPATGASGPTMTMRLPNGKPITGTKEQLTAFARKAGVKLTP